MTEVMVAKSLYALSIPSMHQLLIDITETNVGHHLCTAKLASPSSHAKVPPAGSRHEGTLEEPRPGWERIESVHGERGRWKKRYGG